MHSSYLSQAASAILEAYLKIDWPRSKRTPSHLRSLSKAIPQRRGKMDKGYKLPEDDGDHHSEYDARSNQGRSIQKKSTGKLSENPWISKDRGTASGLAVWQIDHSQTI
jgi:hypothetical protein